MAHIGSGLLAIAFFILLAYGGSFSFDSFRDAAAQIPAVYKNIVFFFDNFRFWNKGGYFPTTSLVAHGSSCGTEQYFNDYVRGNDQDRYLWFYTVLFLNSLRHVRHGGV